MEAVPQSIIKAYQQAIEADESMKGLQYLRRVLLMEAGRIEKQIRNIQEKVPTLS